MIPNIELDVESFETILERYKQMVQTIYPEWTNYNQHDSGILLVELFSWMKEMQEFHLNQIGSAHFSTYLKLLGSVPAKKQCARAVVQCFDVKKKMMVKENSRLYAGNIPFETIEQIYLYEGRLRSVLSLDSMGIIMSELPVDHPQVNMNIPIFGKKPATGCSFIMRFSSAFLMGREYNLYFDVKDDYQVLRNPIVDGKFTPLVTLKMEYTSGGKWVSCHIIRDETSGFLKKGMIRFVIPAAEKELLGDQKEWEIRISMAYGEYDIPPVIQHIYPNSIWVMQCETICFSAESEEGVLGIGNGFPNQRYSVGFADVLAESIEITVASPDHAGEYVHWVQVNGFEGSAPEDLHYRIDNNTGEVVFGDGFWGMPPEGEISIAAGKKSLGAAGNVKKERITDYKFSGDQEFQIINPDHAFGGKNAETLEECFTRFQCEIKTSRSAVNLHDYEEIVRSTPGLMISNVKAIADESGENAIRIVVQPFSLEKNKELSLDYQRNILGHLESQRLIGTSVHILSPEYISISLYLEIEFFAHYHNSTEQVYQMLYHFFEQNQSEFGKPVLYGTIYGFLNAVNCIKRVSSLTMDAGGKGVERNVRGDVILPVYGLAYLEHIQCSISFSG